MDINGKRIVLTGAASGIGKAVLERLAAYDAQILAVDLAAERVTIPANARAKITPHACDVGQQANVDALFDHAVSVLGGIDIFIANAGFAYYEKLESPDWNHIDAIYRVNVFSPLYSLQKMRALNAGKAHTVVITASAMARLALPGYALYASTKAALDRFAEAYRHEADQGSHLMMVYPIGTRTNFFTFAGAPQTWPTQSVEEVAAALVQGIERDAKAVFPSLLYRVTSFFNRFLPIMFLPTTLLDKRRFDLWVKQQR
jgi:uncharacterized protein